MLFDFWKAFNLINHHALLQKMMSYNIPRHALAWITDFLTDRKQRVKINNDCFSQWGDITAGVLQGTKVSPWLFLIMINNLLISNSVLWKYVNDTTLLELVNKNGNSTLQLLKVDKLIEKTKADGFQLNETKCKEVRITFCRAGFTADPIIIQW